MRGGHGFLVLALFVLGLLSPMGSHAAADLPPDIAFYYGTRPPIDALRHYDEVVVQPNQLRPEETAALLASGPLIFAYVSVGEVARNSVDMPRIDQRWVVGTNTAWNSLVMDLAGTGWREFLIREHFAPLWQQGYRAFFLDTMDSYLLVAKTGAPRQQQEDGMVALMAEVKRRFPGVRLIFNRGFELLERHGKYADAILAESLFHGYDPISKRHAPTAEANRTWLINNLKRARDQFNVPAIVLDYVDPGDWRTAEATARDILALGFMPWVANGDLTWLGQGRIRHVPRTVLALIEDDPTAPSHSQWSSPLFKHLALPLEYEGYRLEYLNIEQQALPAEPLSGRYAGVVGWLSPRSAGQQAGICARLQAEVSGGLPVLFLGSLPAGAACQQLIGYQQNGRKPAGALKVVAQDATRVKPLELTALRQWGLPDARIGTSGSSLLQLSDSSGARFDPIQIGPFGGLALDPYVIQYGADGSASWLLDPFALVQTALRLPVLPVFDTSSENGRRIGLVEVRGDRLFSSNADGHRAVELFTPLLREAGLAGTLALVEAEFTSPPLSDSERQTRLAALQPLLILPGLELAQHSYSHPFFWPVFDGQRDFSALLHTWSIAVPGYAAELTREIAGPNPWLNALRRSDPNDRTDHLPLLIWPGDGRPGPAALATAQKATLRHYGGGGLEWKFGAPQLAQLYPSALPTAWGTQVLTPLVDENLFARLWYGDALNYRKVLDWNRQLGSGLAGPRRLKPWSLSIQADAVLRPGGTELLKDLLVTQRAELLTALTIGDYVERVQGFQQASLAIDLDGNWRLHGNGARSVRLPAALPWPLPQPALVGSHQDASGRYLHLSDAPLKLRFAGSEPAGLLVDASAPLQHWQPATDGTVSFSFVSRAQISFRVRLPNGCELQQDGDPLRGRNEVMSGSDKPVRRYELQGDAVIKEVQLVCTP